MSELKAFIELVEQKNLLFKLEQDEFFNNRAGKEFFIIEDFIEEVYDKNRVPQLKYDLAHLIHKSVDDEPAVIELGKYLNNDKVLDEIANFKKVQVVKLAEELKQAYLSGLGIYDGAMVLSLATNALYEGNLGVFTEVSTGKMFPYRGAANHAFHNIINKPDTILIKDGDIYLKKNFVELYFPSISMKPDIVIGLIDGFYKSKRFESHNYKTLAHWRLKINSSVGFNLAMVPAWNESFINEYRFFMQNDGYFFNIENIVKEVNKLIREDKNQRV